MLKRDYVKAQESLDVVQRIDPKEPNLAIIQGVLYALTNRREDAEKQLSIVKSYKESFRLSGELSIQNALGNYDEAFKALMRQAETHSWDHLIRFDPLYEGLRKDPRFSEFCKKVGLPP
jgi:hypothetical protein